MSNTYIIFLEEGINYIIGQSYMGETIINIEKFHSYLKLTTYPNKFII